MIDDLETLPNEEALHRAAVKYFAAAYAAGDFEFRSLRDAFVAAEFDESLGFTAPALR